MKSAPDNQRRKSNTLFKGSPEGFIEWGKSNDADASASRAAFINSFTKYATITSETFKGITYSIILSPDNSFEISKGDVTNPIFVINIKTKAELKNFHLPDDEISHLETLLKKFHHEKIFSDFQNFRKKNQTFWTF